MYKSFAREGSRYDKEILLSDESMLNPTKKNVIVMDMKVKMKKMNA